MKRFIMAVVILFSVVVMLGLSSSIAYADGDRKDEILSILKDRHADAPSSEDIQDKSRLRETNTASTTTYISSNTVLTASKNYPGNVFVKSTGTLDLNGKAVTIAGDLIIQGLVLIKGGSLTVTGDIIVDCENFNARLDIGGGAVTVRDAPSSAFGGSCVIAGGLINVYNSGKLIIQNGDFVTMGSADGQLTSGTIDINGGFYQFGTINTNNFCPRTSLKVIMRGTASTPRDVYFEYPEYSYFSDFQLASGTVLSKGSLVSFCRDLAADNTITLPNVSVAFHGNLNGHTLTVDSSELVLVGTVYVNGGTIDAKGDLVVLETAWLRMEKSTDRLHACKNFYTMDSGSRSLYAGVLEIDGDFYQYNSIEGAFPGESYIPGPDFITRFTCTNAYVEFEDPDSSYFTKLELGAGAAFDPDSTISIRRDLSEDVIDTPWDYPNLVYGGNLNGKTLTLACDLTIGNPGVTLNGGTIHALQDVMLGSKLYMKKTSDRVIVEGDFIVTKNHNSGDQMLSSGTLELNGNFIISTTGESFNQRAFDASGSHKTILRGINKRVIFPSPLYSYFKDIEIDVGTTFTYDSTISFFSYLTSDLTVDVPSVYYSGNLQGHKLQINGSLFLISGMNDVVVGNGELIIRDNFTISGSRFLMTNVNDVVRVGGRFVAQGGDTTGRLTNGTMYVKGDFIQRNTVSNKSFFATSPHKTVFDGASSQTIQFDADDASQSKFGDVLVINSLTSFADCYYDNITVPFLDLSTLSVEDGISNPAFAQQTYLYKIIVPKGISSTTLQVSKVAAGATVTIDGVQTDTKVISGIPYSSCKEVQIVVSHTGNTATHTYVVRMQQLNTDLAGIGLSSGSLNELFEPGLLNYTVDLPAASESIEFTPLLDNTDSSFTILGETVASKVVDIVPGDAKVVVIRVTGQDGVSTKDYTVTVRRPPLLDNIEVTGGALSPAFGFTTDSYQLTIPAAVDSATITPVKAAGCESLTIDGEQRESLEAALPQPGQSRTVVIVARVAGSEATHTYRVVVTRAPLIYGFSHSGTGAVLSTEYAPTTFQYTLTLPTTTGSVTISPAVNPDCADMSIKVGDGVFEAIDTVEIDVAIGQTLPVLIKAKLNETVEQTYTVNVTRTPLINSISVRDNNLVAYPSTIAFSPDIHFYKVPIPANKGTLVRLNCTTLSGTITTDGINGGYTNIQLNPGERRTVRFVATATDGVTKAEYEVEVICTNPLDGISVDPYTFKYEDSYDLVIPSVVTSVNIQPIKNSSCAKLVIHGVEADSHVVNPPYNYSSYKVEATDNEFGVTTVYSVNVNRVLLVYDLQISAGTLSPAYSYEEDNYNLYLPQNVSSVTIFAENSNVCYNIPVETVTLPMGGHKVVTMTARGVNGGTYDITIDVYRIAPITGISLSKGTLSPAFSITGGTYTVNIPATQPSITVTPVVAGSCNNMTINGQSVSSVVLSPAIGGSAKATIAANAVNGQDFSYTVNVNRAALITGIKPSIGTLSPAFKATTLDYSVFVPVTTTTVRITPTKAASGVKSMTINGAAVAYADVRPPIGGNAKATITATATDGITKVTYTVTVKRAALLTGIGLSTGTLTPAFSPTMAAYTVSIPADKASVTVTPVKATSGVKSMTINGVAVAAVTLKPAVGGKATATIVVTATDGISKSTYTVTAVRAPIVTGIAVAGGSLSPTFNSATTSYSISIPAATASVVITPAKAEICTGLMINGVEQESVTLAPAIGGSASATITGRTATNTTVTYTVKVNRATMVTSIKSGSTAYPLSPAFSPLTPNYTITLPATVSSVTVNATKAASGVKSMTMNGQAITTVTARPPVGGSVVIKVVATATDGITTSTYTITVKRAALISRIAVTGGTLSPVFSPTTATYTVSLPADMTSVTIAPVKAASGVRSMTINGAAVASVALKPAVGGKATATIVATATDGITKSTYTVTAVRAPIVTGIAAEGGTLSPAFNTAMISYSINVPATTASVSLNVSKAEICTNLKINNVEQESITLTPAIGGSATATITGRTAANTVVTYTVKVNRAALVTSIKSSSTAYPLSPAFSPLTPNYTITLPATVSSITVSATKAASGVKSMTMNGQAVTSITARPLVGGSTVIKVEAIATDGITSSTYTITVKRTTLITGIIVTGGTLTPTFNSGTTSYTVNIPASVSTVKITPVKAPSGVKSMTINGAAVSYVNLSPAVGGKATATIVATALDSISKATYTVQVVRHAPLTGIAVSAGTLAFSPTKLNYDVNVPAETEQVTVTPTAAAGCGYEFGEGGSIAAPDAGSTTTITVNATASDGATRMTYTIRVHRAPALTGINVSAGSLAFDPADKDYTVAISSGVESVTVTPTAAAGWSYAINGGDANTPVELHPLPGGSTTATIVVTAPGGPVQVTYTITVNRGPALDMITATCNGSDLDIEAVPNSGGLEFVVHAPALAEGEPNAKVTVSAIHQATTSVTINDEAVSSLEVDKPADSESLILMIAVIPENGLAPVTYTVTILWDTGTK